MSLLHPRLPEAHGDRDPPSRYVTCPKEELLRFENRERYVAQSEATRDNKVAALPPRRRLLRIVR
jgi:hypothetical protein